MARKVCWLVDCEIDVMGHPGASGIILHFTHFMLGHVKCFSDILNSEVECRAGQVCKYVNYHCQLVCWI